MTSSDASDRPGGFSVLLVCSANICRSPMAASLLCQQVVDAGLGWTITSAGTHARAGARIAPLTGEVLGEIGLAPLTYESRPVTGELVAAADLVLTVDTRTRHEIASHHVTALRRTFTVRQFARLCSVVVLDSDDPGAAGPSLLVGAGLARQRVQPALDGADDIADPYGQDIAQFRQARDVMVAAIADIMRPVRAAVDGSRGAASAGA